MAETENDIRVLRDFVQVFCDDRHTDISRLEVDGLVLCAECHEILSYSEEKREQCPLNPKPKCKRCEIHCYDSEYRDKIMEIMRHSGFQMIKWGRFDLVFHYFF